MAAKYIQIGSAKIAFVATNSITQGEQVSQLWPALFDRYGLEISFGHRTFEWLSDARGRAHVHCVIVGLTRRTDQPKDRRLFTYEDIAGNPIETLHTVLSPYLVDASSLANPHLIVERSRNSLAGRPQICLGSKPVDGGYYILDEEQKTALLKDEPTAARIIRPYIGAYEYINGVSRWIIYPGGATTTELRQMPVIMRKIAEVRRHREEAEGSLSRELASVPTEFHVTVVPEHPFLAIPEVSSERREYIPIGWMQPPTIPSNKILVFENATLFEFGVLTSKLHTAWARHIGSRLKSDFQYSPGIVYNTFPWPTANDKAREKISGLAQAVLNARAAHVGSTLADLYDPDTMPTDVRKAHTALDKAVDQLYRRAPFTNDRERVEHLFALYEKLVAGRKE